MKLRGLLGVAWAASWVGCQMETKPPAIGDDPGPGRPGECVDQDGDGFGPNCARGPDCDDARATITSECFACMHDAPRCPCAEDGVRKSCGKVTARIGMQTTCASGEMLCAGGRWGECWPDGKAIETITTARHGLGIGRATPCTGNPCDPYCRQYADTPDETLSNGTGLIGTDSGLTLAPGDAGGQPSDAWFIRDYDTTDVCTAGAVPYWSFFAWNATALGGAHIDFEIAVAPSVAELATSPIDWLQFSDPPGPAGLVGQAISARSGAPDTQAGGTLIDWTLRSGQRARTSRAMRLRAHLVASPDLAFAPVLHLWNQSISCQPAE
jgi:hypothetical protein